VSQPWRFLSLSLEMDDDELSGLLLGAARADDVAVEDGGRRALVWVWRGPRDAPGARRLGAAWLRRGTPGPGLATLEQIGWDPRVGDHPRLWDRLERLAPKTLGRARTPAGVS
jgi:hypothetical protein